MTGLDPAWGLSWNYDGFGNRLSQNLTKGTGPTNSTLVDANTNRISSFGYQYDQNGNMTNMPQQNAQMTYDSSNRMTRFSDLNDAESYQYAPDNKRIWRSKGCSYYNQATGNNEARPQIIFYSAFGQKLGEYCLTDNVTVIREYLYFGGRMVARSNGSNLESFKTDRLHSNQDAPGGGFFPFGETKSGATTTGESFATYSRDWHGLDYADQRWFLPSIGRYTTVDPILPGNEDDPSSYNYYAYVLGDPINHSDPEGLDVKDIEINRGSKPTCLSDQFMKRISGDVNKWLDSDVGTMALQVWFEWQDADTPGARNMWNSLANVYRNRWKLSNADKVKNGFTTAGFKPLIYQASGPKWNQPYKTDSKGRVMKDSKGQPVPNPQYTQSHWAPDGNLKADKRATLINQLNLSPSHEICRGLIAAFEAVRMVYEDKGFDPTDGAIFYVHSDADVNAPPVNPFKLPADPIFTYNVGPVRNYYGITKKAFFYKPR